MSLFKYLFSWDYGNKPKEEKPDWISMLNDLKKIKEEGIGEVSEPVISFIKTFKDNPKRFKITLAEDTMFDSFGDRFKSYMFYQKPSIHLRLTDKKVDLYWDFFLVNKFFNSRLYLQEELHPLYNYPKFLNEKEARLIYQKFYEYGKYREGRYKQLKSNRQREALKKVYCK